MEEGSYRTPIVVGKRGDYYEGQSHASALVDEWDATCTSKCRSVQHGNMIYAIGTKGSDTQVINLWMRTCQNFSRIKDEFGRSAIHVAAATGRTRVVIWLIKAHDVSPNIKELSDGYTPLHVSLFYGQIHVARALLQNGAVPSLTIVDNEGLTPMELIVKDRPPPELSNIEFDVLVWGSNRNYSLGIEKENGRTVPDILEAVPPLTESGFVVLQKYHSVYVIGGKSAVYVAGTGPRLGLKSMSAMMPVPVRFHHSEEVNCTQVAAGPDHTIFLMENGSVWGCGSNQNCVLGLDLDPSSDGIVREPRRLQTLRPYRITNVAASQYHSVFCSDHEVFVCGINYGQLGLVELGRGEKVLLPKLVPTLWLEPKSGGRIMHVSCNEYATVIAHGPFLHVLHENKRNYFNIGYFPIISILKSVVTGGNDFRGTTGSSPGKPNSGLNSVGIFLVATSNRPPHEPKVWRIETYGRSHITHPITLCVGRPIVVKDIAVNQFGLLIVTKDGEGFQGLWDYSNELLDEKQHAAKVKAKNNQRSGNRAQYYGSVEIIKLKRIPNLENGYKAACCPNNDSFAVTKWRRLRDQKDTFRTLLDLQNAEDPYQIIASSLLALLADASIEDSIHDCVFVVAGGVEFPAHRFILSQVAKPLHDLVSAAATSRNEDKQDIRVVIQEVTANIFGAILRLAYSAGHRDLVKTNDLQDSVSAFNKWSKTCVPDVTHRPEFPYTGQVEFSDVVIVCSDGIKLPAHRCMLASRLPYFGMMFGSNAWSESNLSLPEVKIPFPVSTVSWLLKYIYVGDSLIQNDEHWGIMDVDIESLRQIIQMSDMFLCGHLRACAETAMILSLTQRNATEMLKLSHQYNCHSLQRACIEFLIENMVYDLENRMLDTLSEDLVERMSTVYKETILEPNTLDRVLRPYSTCPWDVVYDSATSPMDSSQLELTMTNRDSLLPETSLNVIKKNKTKPRFRTKSEASQSETSQTQVMHIDKTEPNLNEEEETHTKWTKVPTQGERRRLRTLSTNSDTIVPVSIPIPIPTKLNVELQQVPARKSLRIPIPLKEKSMQEQNLRLKQQEAYYDIASDFPTLADYDAKEASSIPSPSTPITISKEGGSKGGKKKLKWVPVQALSIEKIPPGCGDEEIGSQTVPATPPPPQNPWKVKESPKAGGSITTNVEFQKIVAEEKEKQENFLNATQKPLKLVQIEEEAMEAFRAQFTTQDVLDGIELLEIRRNDQHRLYADPVWPCERPRSFGAPAPVSSTSFQSPSTGRTRTESITMDGPAAPDEFPELK